MLPCHSPEAEIDEALRAERRLQIERVFRERDIPIREDSVLIRRFVDGTCDVTYATADDVANTMHAVDYVYKRTVYGEVVQDTLRHLADGLHAEYPLVSWTQLWETVREHAPLALKLQCLAVSGTDVVDSDPVERSVAISQQPL